MRVHLPIPTVLACALLAGSCADSIELGAAYELTEGQREHLESRLETLRLLADYGRAPLDRHFQYHMRSVSPAFREAWIAEATPVYDAIVSERGPWWGPSEQRIADARSVPQLQGGPPDYLRTNSEIHAALHALEANHPELASVEDIGDSASKVKGIGGWDLLALRLGAGADKPRAIFLAGVHGGEIANPELMVRWATDLLGAYGEDETVTHLLDTTEVVVIPLVNPDGHEIAEANAWTRASSDPRIRDHLLYFYERVNANGVDLNRNFEHAWEPPGLGNGLGTGEYPGESAASEPEVQAVQAFVTANPIDLFVDWHSYMGEVLYPWAHASDSPPDDAALRAIGSLIGDPLGYEVNQMKHVYFRSTGVGADWAYAVGGSAAFVVETFETEEIWEGTFHDHYAQLSAAATRAALAADRDWRRGSSPRF